MVQDAFELHPKPNEKSAPKGSPFGGAFVHKNRSKRSQFICDLYHLSPIQMDNKIVLIDKYYLVFEKEGTHADHSSG
jgi:hypothetical protein